MKRNWKTFFFMFILTVSLFNVLSWSWSWQVSNVVAIEEPEDEIILQPDWTGFWQRFRKHAMWDLEWHNGDAWTSIKSDLSIQRDYPEPNTCKITLVFDASHTADYRLTFAIDARVRTYVAKLDKYQYNLTYDLFSIVFDWSDIMSLPNLQVTHGIKNVAGSDYFWFRVRKNNVHSGVHVEIDPTITGTSTSEVATSYGFQRKSFYQHAKYWLFYSNGSDIVYRTCTFLITPVWSSETIIRTGTTGYRFSVWANGSHVAYADGYGADLSYRLGETNSTGGITWCDLEQTVSSDFAYTPSIALDSNGYPWITYKTPYNGHVNVTKSAWKNGTWSTDTGFPVQISQGTANANFRQMILPLDGGTMYVLYGATSRINGSLYDGANWGSPEYISSSSMMLNSFSAVVDSSYNIHLSFLRSTTYDVTYLKRTGSNWGSEVELDADETTSSYTVMSVNQTNDDLFVFWENSDYIYYVYYDGSSWSDTVTWITDTTVQSATLTCFYNVTSNRLAIFWSTSTDSPRNIMFDELRFDGYTQTFQARYESQIDFALRTVNFKGTASNGSSFNVPSNTTGNSGDLIICYGTLDFAVWWSNHRIFSITYPIISSHAYTVDTSIRKFTSNSYYLLFSLNDTDLTTPEAYGNDGWTIHDATASDSPQFRMDNANWKRTDEPSTFTDGTAQYSKGTGSWSFSNNIFTFTLADGTKHLTMTWTSSSTGASGSSSGSSGSYQPPVTPATTEPATTEPEATLDTFAPPSTVMGSGAIVIIGVVAVVIAHSELQRKKPTPRQAWRKKGGSRGKRVKWPAGKSRRPKWKQQKSKKVKWPKKHSKKPQWKNRKLYD